MAGAINRDSSPAVSQFPINIRASTKGMLGRWLACLLLPIIHRVLQVSHKETTGDESAINPFVQERSKGEK